VVIGWVGEIRSVVAQEVVPDLLGNWLEQRNRGRLGPDVRAGRARPVGRDLRVHCRVALGDVAVIEIGTADGYVVGRGGETADRQAEGCDRLGVEVVASG